MARVLGLDVGSKTVGIAVSDETRLIASPLETLERKGTARDVAAIAERVRASSAERIVVGLPLDEEGNVGLRAKRVLVLVEALKAAGLEVETWDERFSTVAVERVLIEADVSRRRRKEVVDKMAAAYILQGWLDAQSARGQE